MFILIHWVLVRDPTHSLGLRGWDVPRIEIILHELCELLEGSFQLRTFDILLLHHLELRVPQTLSNQTKGLA